MEITKRITRDFVWNNRDKIIFLFGDNLLYKGEKGQAIIRGLPNAYGIPTKRVPCLDEKVCYLNDNMFELYAAKINQAIEEVPRDGRKIFVIPKIGEGNAEMPKRCPKLYEFLMKRLIEEFNY